MIDRAPGAPASERVGEDVATRIASVSTQGYYLFYAAPYVLTLAILVATSSPTRSLAGAPGALSITK